jgi:hypothetical protein
VAFGGACFLRTFCARHIAPLFAPTPKITKMAAGTRPAPLQSTLNTPEKW